MCFTSFDVVFYEFNIGVLNVYVEAFLFPVYVYLLYREPGSCPELQ